MSSSFSLRLSQVSDTPNAELRDVIRARTGDDEATDSILRGIERLGSDPSIEHYEMTPLENRPSFHSVQRVSWSVRAVRAAPPTED